MKKRFTFLRIVAGFYKLLAVLSFIGGVAAAVVGGFLQVNSGSVEMTQALPVIAGGIAGGIIAMIVLWAMAQIFEILIALEENTRATTLMLQRLNKNLQDRGL